MGSHVLCMDKDIRLCIFMLCNMSTILNWMKTDMFKRVNRTTFFDDEPDEVNYSRYSDKMVDYAPVFDQVVNDFVDEIFGEFANRIP